MKTVYVHHASLAEQLYTNRALRAIRIYFILGLAPSGICYISLECTRTIYLNAGEALWICIYYYVISFKLLYAVDGNISLVEPKIW